LFIKRIGGVFVVIVFVENGVGDIPHKKLFSHGKTISLLDDNKC
jgi:hypothetical protein